MAIGQDFYGTDSRLYTLPQQQASAQLGFGAEAARLADPFANERQTYQKQLRDYIGTGNQQYTTGPFGQSSDWYQNQLQGALGTQPKFSGGAFGAAGENYLGQLNTLLQNPGEFGSSPVYEFAYNKGLDALNRSAAARGRLGSGNYLADLMDYGKKSVSELYYPQAQMLSSLAQGAGALGQSERGQSANEYFNRVNSLSGLMQGTGALGLQQRGQDIGARAQQSNLLSALAGATTGSPAAAGLSYMGSANRAQDLEQQALANQLYGRQPQGGGAQQAPSYMNVPPVPAFNSGATGNSFTPNIGGSIPQLSSGAGTGYVSSQSGTQNFGIPSTQNFGLPSGGIGDIYSDPFSSYGMDYYGDSGGYGGAPSGGASGAYDPFYGGDPFGGYSGGNLDYSADFGDAIDYGGYGGYGDFGGLGEYDFSSGDYGMFDDY